MKKLLLLVSLLPGCTTLSTIGTMNRVVPSVQKLVYLQDYANTTGAPVFQEFCGKAPDTDELVRIAKLMGWYVSNKNSGECVTVIYPKK